MQPFSLFFTNFLEAVVTKLNLQYRCARCQTLFCVPLDERTQGSRRDPVSGNFITDPREIARDIAISMFPRGNGQPPKNQLHDCNESKRKAEAEALKGGLPGLIPATHSKIAFGLATFVGIEEVS